MSTEIQWSQVRREQRELLAEAHKQREAAERYRDTLTMARRCLNDVLNNRETARPRRSMHDILVMIDAGLNA